MQSLGFRVKRTKLGLIAVILSIVSLIGETHQGPLRDRSNSTPAKRYVRKVDNAELSQLSALAERSRDAGNRYYPKVLELISDGKSSSPKTFDIILKRSLPLTHRGVKGITKGTKIYLDGTFLSNNPVYLEGILVHEMAHVAQSYGLWNKAFKIPDYWREGIADYVTFKLGLTNGPRCAECSYEFPHYSSGFTCAGAFLLFVENRAGSNVVSQLNHKLRSGKYSDEFFKTHTGKSLSELWAEFEATSAFTPIAAEINKLREDFRVTDGKLERRSVPEFERYLREHHSDSEIGDLHAAMGYSKGKPPPNVIDRYALLEHFRGPTGKLSADAGEALQSLRNKGELPMDSDEMWFEMIPQGASTTFPVTRTFRGHKLRDDYLYCYTLTKETESKNWKLLKVWRVDSTGNPLVEHSGERN